MKFIKISKEEYDTLKEKARELDIIIDKEGLSKEDLQLLAEAEKSNTLTEETAKKRYSEFFSNE